MLSLPTLIVVLALCVGLVYTSSITAEDHQQLAELLTVLKPFEYLENHMNLPADKVFYGVDLDAQDLSALSKSYDPATSTSFLEIGTSISTSLNVCPPLVTEMCKPCHKFEEYLHSDACGKWGGICEKFFCDPLCRRDLWTVEITASGDEEFKGQVESPEVKEMLQAYFIEYGCGDMLGCCTPTPGTNYMELYAYQGQYARLGTVMKCRMAPTRAKGMELCEGNIDVKVITNPDACNKYGVHEPTDTMKAAFKRAGIEETPSSNTAAQKRCKELVEKIEAQKGAMEAKFKEIACPCAGCGDHKLCPNSLAFDVLPESFTEFDDTNYLDHILQPSRQ